MSALSTKPQQLNLTVTTAGTRKQLSASQLSAHSITIQANPGNTGKIYIGDGTVSSSVYGIVLSAGQSFSISGDGNSCSFDLADFYADAGVNGEGFSVFYI